MLETMCRIMHTVYYTGYFIRSTFRNIEIKMKYPLSYVQKQINLLVYLRIRNRIYELQKLESQKITIRNFTIPNNTISNSEYSQLFLHCNFFLQVVVKNKILYV